MEKITVERIIKVVTALILGLLIAPCVIGALAILFNIFSGIAAQLLGPLVRYLPEPLVQVVYDGCMLVLLALLGVAGYLWIVGVVRLAMTPNAPDANRRDTQGKQQMQMQMQQRQ